MVPRGKYGQPGPDQEGSKTLRRRKMEFRAIDKSNYWDCMALTVDESQKWFAADNKQSLIEAAYEDGL